MLARDGSIGFTAVLPKLSFGPRKNTRAQQRPRRTFGDPKATFGQLPQQRQHVVDDVCADDDAEASVEKHGGENTGCDQT